MISRTDPMISEHSSSAPYAFTEQGISVKDMGIGVCATYYCTFFWPFLMNNPWRGSVVIRRPWRS